MPRIKIPSEFKCRITGKVMRNPVTTPSGHHYERIALENWFKNHDYDFVTHEKLATKTYSIDSDLRKQIDSLSLCTDSQLWYALRSGDVNKYRNLNYEDDCFKHVYDCNGNAEGRRETFFHYAVSTCRPELVKYLIIKEDVDVNVKDDFGNTPLHLAVHFSDLETLKVLLNAGADIEAKNKNGDTALHLAIYANPVGPIKKETILCLQELLANGANIKSRNNYGLMPCTTARRSEISELMSKYDVTYLARKIDSLEMTVEKLQKQIQILLSETNHSASAALEGNASKRFGTLYK